MSQRKTAGQGAAAEVLRISFTLNGVPATRDSRKRPL